MIHSQANELLATFATANVYLFAGSVKNLPRLLITF